jgi:GntR family transcriptional regulator/MocR family aminotransferase
VTSGSRRPAGCWPTPNDTSGFSEPRGSLVRRRPADRRCARTALAQHGALVIEDDDDGEFRYDRHQVGALQALAPERVTYVGTASKSLSPSLRLGWLVLPRFLVDPVLAALSREAAAPSMLDQLVLADLISSGAYDRQVRRCRLEYRSRRDRLVAALPERLAPHGISAGLHLFVPLSPTAEAAVPAAAARHSIALERVSPHAILQAAPLTGLMIGYGAAPKPSFSGALTALLAVLSDIGVSPPPPPNPAAGSCFVRRAQSPLRGPARSARFAAQGVAPRRARL